MVGDGEDALILAFSRAREKGHLTARAPLLCYFLTAGAGLPGMFTLMEHSWLRLVK
jgi:hypothetical protein